MTNEGKWWLATFAGTAAGLALLRVAGVISGPWWLILAPLWVPVAVALVFLGAVLACFAIADLINRL